MNGYLLNALLFQERDTEERSRVVAHRPETEAVRPPVLVGAPRVARRVLAAPRRRRMLLHVGVRQGSQHAPNRLET